MTERGAVNTYRILGDLVGTPDARDLAEQLVVWHDSMVKHLRLVGLRGAACTEDCPHVQARALWPAACDLFGNEAGKLAFLRAHGAQALVC